MPPEDFARVLPVNQLARRLFSRCFAFCRKDDPFHLSFMVPLPDEPPTIPDEPVESSTEYESYHSADADESLQWGFFALSLEVGRLPEFPHLGWRFGRGARKQPYRGVDILLAKPGDISSKSLASKHFSLRVSKQSGLLMLQCGDAKNIVLDSHVNGAWEPLATGQERLMFQHCTMIRAGRCEFELQYTIDDDREAFLARRNLFIRSMLGPTSDVFSSSVFLPGDDITVRGRYLQLMTRGRGTFGWISQGIDTRTGNLIAIKEIRLEHQRSWPEVKNEVDMGRRFQVSHPLTRQISTDGVQDMEGLLPLLDAACEHGCADACSIPEKYYFYFPFATADLSTGFWTDADIPRNNKLQLLEQPLQGLRTLHEIGIMHRDIRPQNILRLSVRPPRATICDYGKALEAEKSQDTQISPIHTLAPEVWTGPYTRAIDVWAYGYAIAEVLGYRGWIGNPRITHERHDAVSAILQHHMRQYPDDKDLVDLALQMLAGDPRRRPTAAEALDHRCWAPIQCRDVPDVAGKETRKRSKVAHTVEEQSQIDSGAGTRKFSPETERFLRR